MLWANDVANFGCNNSSFLGISGEIVVVMKGRGKHKLYIRIAHVLKKNLPESVK
jgi:hypothetical protein